MAIRCDASGDSLSRARLAGAKTVMAWIYLAADRNDYTVFFGLGSNELIGTGSDGTTLIHYDGAVERTSSNLATGTWYHLAYVSAGDAISNGFTVYLNGVSSITTGGRSGTSAGTNMYLGNDEYSEWLNGRLAHIKVWSAALTQTEVQQEMYSIRPHRFANLHSWLPTIDTGSARTTDYAGQGNGWTANGTLADEAGPPVGWGAPVWVVPFVAASGDQQINVSDAAAGADALAQLRATLGLADSGSGAEVFGGAASVPLADAGTAGDLLAQMLASVPVAESGSGADSRAIRVSLTLTDAGVGMDATLELVLAAITDSGAGLDAIQSITATVPVIDNGAGLDTLVLTVTLAVSDAAAGLDALQLLTEAVKQVVESGSGADVVMVPAIRVGVSEGASGADALALTVTLGLSDAASGHDALVAAVSLAIADIGAGAEAVGVLTATLITLFEMASGGDALAVNVAPLTVQEGGAGLDAAGVAVFLTLTDAAMASDTLLASVLVAVSDAAAGIDTPGSITVSVPVADIGQAVDALAAIRTVLAVVELGAGVDVTVSFDSAVRLVRIAFTLFRRSVAFAWLMRTLQCTWDVRQIVFELS
jgi:hypothetical protein